ncbi:MAG TPA: CARDB domain-containing protein [Thermoproteota archaeon]|nr:CARDB domain-containing protein [Thermoproteota archaeon]
MFSRRNIAFFTLIFAILPLSILTSATATEVIDVKYFKPPILNGVISTGEYPDPVYINPTVKVYTSHNGSALFFAVSVSDATNNQQQDRFQLFIKPYGSQNLMTTDWMIEVNRTGESNFYWYSGGWKLKPTFPSAIKVVVVSGTSSWVTELRISFDSPYLDITPGQNRTLGFFLRVYDGNNSLLVKPADGDPLNPTTWGTMVSSSWWGQVDLAAVGISHSPSSIVTGQSAKIYVTFKNLGPSPISNVQVDLAINGGPVAPKVFSGTLEPGDSGSVSFDWVAGDGSFTFSAHVSLVGGVYEANTANNVAEKTITTGMLTLSVVAPAGVTITVGTQTQESAGIPVAFTLPWGLVTVSAAAISETPGTRLMFKQWKPTGATSWTISYNMTAATTLEAVYDTYYLCAFTFKDKANRELNGISYVLRFPNSTIRSFVTPGTVWMPVGISKLTGAYVGGLNLLGLNQTVTIEAPIDLTYFLNLRDVTLKVVDIFGLPIQGAALSYTFLNGTTFSVTTPSDGIVVVSRVPLSKLNATATFLGFSGGSQVDATVPQPEYRITLTISFPVLAVLVGVPLVIIVIVAFILIRSRFKS